MSKKILELCGSPRAGGNSDLLADAFIEGARMQGHEVTKIRAAELHIDGCRACDACWTKGRACVFEDDFQTLSPLLESAGVLALAFPLYWSAMPAQLKAVIDRLYAYCPGKCLRPLAIEESVLLACGECEAESAFGDAVHLYQDMASYFGWQQRGCVLAPKVHHKGDIKRSEALERARLLGASL